MQAVSGNFGMYTCMNEHVKGGGGYLLSVCNLYTCCYAVFLQIDRIDDSLFFTSLFQVHGWSGRPGQNVTVTTLTPPGPGNVKGMSVWVLAWNGKSVS